MFGFIGHWFRDLELQIAAGMILDSLAWVDWFALLFAFLGVIYGIQNGFLAEIAEILQVMAVIFLTFYLTPHVELFVRQNLRFIPHQALPSASYVVTGAAIWAAAGVLFYLCRRFFHTDLTKPLRTIGGGILGAVHLIIIFSFLVQTVMLMPLTQPKKALQKGGSLTGNYILALAPAIADMVAHPSAIFQENTR